MENKKDQDVLNRLLKVGVGLFAVTEDRVKKFIDDLVEKGEISGTGSGSLAEEISKKFDKGRQEWTARVAQEMKRILKGLDVPSRSEIELIKEDLQEIKSELSRLRKENDPGN